MATSATLNTEKYCTLIKSVTEPNIVRSRAFKVPPVMIMRQPVFSSSEIRFHDFHRKTPIPRSIMGIINEIPGRGVPKATPVFLTWVILRIFQMTEKSGFEILTQYFVRISVRTIPTRSGIYFFIFYFFFPNTFFFPVSPSASFFMIISLHVASSRLFGSSLYFFGRGKLSFPCLIQGPNFPRKT